MFSAVYSSRSSEASSPNSASTVARRSSNASEMYLRKISPSTTCLYSAASIEPRRASAIAHSSASWPVVAPSFGFFRALACCFPDFRRAMLCDPLSQRWILADRRAAGHRVVYNQPRCSSEQDHVCGGRTGGPRGARTTVLLPPVTPAAASVVASYAASMQRARSSIERCGPDD